MNSGGATTGSITKTLKAIILTASVVIIGAGAVRAVEYGLDPTRGTDTVSFRSTAKLEFIEGQTNDIVGGFVYDPNDSQGKVSGVLRVDLRTLRTGIALRDEHMREKHLHTEDYPYAHFELISLGDMPEALIADSAYESQARGFFYIHGVKREITAQLKFSKEDHADGRSESIRAVAEFALTLDDFRIPRPKALFLKLAETIQVRTVFTAYISQEPPLIVLPEWPELR